MSQLKPKAKRRRGRPLKEDSIVIAADKAMFDYKSGVVDLMPSALKTLESLLTNGTEKVKEGVAKFIIAEAKEVHENYLAQDDEIEETKPVSVDNQVEDEDDIIPISLDVR